MSRGGKRQGAGRKKGSLSTKTQEIVAAAAAEVVTPLEFMLSVLRDEQRSFDDRFKAAIQAAPFMHPKLAAVQHSGDADAPLQHVISSAVPRYDADDDDQRPTPKSH